MLTELITLITGISGLYLSLKTFLIPHKTGATFTDLLTALIISLLLLIVTVVYTEL